MDFNKLLEEKNISKYKLSKESGVPYSTVCDISTGKSVLLKCSAETVLRISHVLGMTAEELVGDISYPVTNTGKSSSESKEKEKKTKADGAAGKKAKKSINKTKKEENLDPIKKAYLDKNALCRGLTATV